MKTLKIFLLLFTIMVTTATAQSWEFVGLDSLIVNQIYVTGDTIWASADYIVENQVRSNLHFTSDGGNSWAQLDSVLGNSQIYSFSIIPPETLFMIKIGILYKSINNGETWEVINSISSNPIRWLRISPFNFNEMYSIDLDFVGGGTFNNLYKSIDGGDNWAMLGPFPGSSHGNELSFAFDLTDSMNLYVSVDDHFLTRYFFKSTDKGSSWFYVSSPPVLPIGIFSDYFIPNQVYLFPGPYVSNEGGLNWFLADSGFTDSSYSISFYQDRLTTKLLYNLRTDGLFSSGNDTIVWKLMKESKSLPVEFNSMKKMFIEPARKELYLGTTEGLYKTTIITSVNETSKKELDFSLSQNYPNPFNPGTTIGYQIKRNSFVSLKVYDILGNEIATLVNKEQPAGKYNVSFDTKTITDFTLASGVYIYQIHAGRYVSSRKMIYLK